MSTRTVQFSVEVKNITITSGSFQVFGIVENFIGAVNEKTPFENNTFSVEVKNAESEYYAVTVWVHEYIIENTLYKIEGEPLSLLATFYLPDTLDPVIVNPESSIASIYTFARMTKVDDNGTVRISGTERNMKIAYGMKKNLYKTEGAIGDMISTSPNGFETNSYPMFNSLCNLYYYSLTNPIISKGKPFYRQFLDYAWHEPSESNKNFLQAMRNLIYDPCHNADHIYQMLFGLEEMYSNSLVSMKNMTEDQKIPNNWTLTLKSNSSGAKNFLPSGAAFVVFDADDNAWIANNFRAGSPDSGTHCPVYKYDATPADFSPVQGGGLLGVAFGAAVSPDKKYISFGNFGWGSEYNNPQEGSISRFYYKDGKPVSPSNGFTLGLSRVQGMEYDNQGNLWMASVGCQEPFAPANPGVYPFESEPSAVVVYLKPEDGDFGKGPTEGSTLICNEFPVKRSPDLPPLPIQTPYLKIFDVIPDHKGSAYVSCIGNYDKDVPENCAFSAVYKVAIEGNQLVVTNSWFSNYSESANKQEGYESLRQIAINGNGDVVVVGVSSSRATVLSKDLSTVLGYYDVNTYAPWGVKIDKNETVFLANFGHETDFKNNPTLDMQGPFGVTMLRDISKPETAMLLTLPTGGSEVTLANGYPLYGTQHKPKLPGSKYEELRMQCYQPIMRLTSTNIDGAGNLWCMNNWKPSALVDVFDNPGGDGVVIFLGIAEPE
ncbi:hypothetical protein WH221_10105 [Chryseobacterium culicis]|uniref:Uncharacterized protein n=1 Tax=Chryseobacterium culicis TaxID=680127 RepID=A0A2S9D1D4_CHRCI|nr:hypothetical protein [Chryseobacterium culicis]PRB86575.1 hypothetical protein CQ022_10080 [Chryseobacterium culicis]PRB92328.1 hypothetical protein CQ033_03750 [Chryseobacterium culicis]